MCVCVCECVWERERELSKRINTERNIFLVVIYILIVRNLFHPSVIMNWIVYEKMAFLLNFKDII